jgi:hypothetical protein
MPIPKGDWLPVKLNASEGRFPRKATAPLPFREAINKFVGNFSEAGKKLYPKKGGNSVSSLSPIQKHARNLVTSFRPRWEIDRVSGYELCIAAIWNLLSITKPYIFDWA